MYVERKAEQDTKFLENEKNVSISKTIPEMAKTLLENIIIC